MQLAQLAGVGRACALCTAGCASAPKSFVALTEPGSSAVEITSNVMADHAWQSVVDVPALKTDLDMIHEDSGYTRAGWNCTWTGERAESYRVRATVKFTPDRYPVHVRSEAAYGDEGRRQIGLDDRLLKTLKTDIASVLRRTTTWAAWSPRHTRVCPGRS